VIGNLLNIFAINVPMNIHYLQIILR